jgi:2,4-dienoyl-CoA reductase-like NADH-dependent reductase (Old Yellow Enzyme family)
MLARGDFDLVGVGRALLADAEWPRKVASGDFSALHGFRRSQLDVLN